jgi:hypothetical protein
VNNQAIAQISRIEHYLMVAGQSAIEEGDDLRARAVYQSELIIRMVAGDDRYTLASIMEVE